MTHFAILLGGPVTATERLRRQIAGTRVLAADSGMAHAAPLELDAELWIGDFNSADDALQRAYAHVPRLAFPAEKNATDGELAVDEALRLGATAFTFVGGLGGQADHVLGHLGLALKLAREGHRVLLTSGAEEAQPLLPGRLGLRLKEGSRISIVPFADLTGLDLSGVKWPLVRRDVPLGSSLTLSNMALGPVTIGLAQGYGMIISYPLP